MPIYEYKCTHCGHKKEVLQKLSDPPLRECPACGEAKLRKLISAAGFQLKGSGWYATDFKGGGAKAGKEKEEKNPEGKTADAEKKPDSGKAGGGETAKEERKESKESKESKPDKASDSATASTTQ
jgi:putative FmdB family regulatory protein